MPLLQEAEHRFDQAACCCTPMPVARKIRKETAQAAANADDGEAEAVETLVERQRRVRHRPFDAQATNR